MLWPWTCQTGLTVLTRGMKGMSHDCACVRLLLCLCEPPVHVTLESFSFIRFQRYYLLPVISICEFSVVEIH